MTPEQEATELIKLFKEEEVFEYDIVYRHAVIRAVKCCDIMMRENFNGERNLERAGHLKSVYDILNNKLK